MRIRRLRRLAAGVVAAAIVPVSASAQFVADSIDRAPACPAGVTLVPDSALFTLALEPERRPGGREYDRNQRRALLLLAQEIREVLELPAEVRTLSPVTPTWSDTGAMARHPLPGFGGTFALAPGPDGRWRGAFPREASRGLLGGSLEATHRAFIEAGRESILTATFEPARIGWCRVPTLVQQRISWRAG